jgi:hypothetical protein
MSAKTKKTTTTKSNPSKSSDINEWPEKMQKLMTQSQKDFDYEKSPSAQKLVKALEAQPQSQTRDNLIENAKTGTYNDYFSDLGMPIATLVADLANAGYLDLSEAAKDGEFDGD